MIESVSHITFIVKDLEMAAHFFCTIFNAEEVYGSTKKYFSISDEKFFIIGGIWVAIMEGNRSSVRSYDHVAFKVPDSEFDDYLFRIRQLGVEIKPGRDRVEGEARSVYFYDYDDHLFELHTGTLQERLMRYANG